jgi:polygalacturonase
MRQEILIPDKTGHSSGTLTKDIQELIDDMSAGGGGCIVLTGGTFEVSTVVLKSHVKLVIEADAVLKATGDITQYQTYAEDRDDGSWQSNRKHLIFAEDVHDIEISGTGVIDGNLSAFLETDPWGGWRKCPDKERLSRMA